eukprot:Clim_evm17s204 gene=Clim_evmTU17s204
MVGKVVSKPRADVRYRCNGCNGSAKVEDLLACGSCQRVFHANGGYGQLRSDGDQHSSCALIETHAIFCPWCLRTVAPLESLLGQGRCGTCYECPICGSGPLAVSKDQTSTHSFRCRQCEYDSKSAGLTATNARSLLQRTRDLNLGPESIGASKYLQAVSSHLKNIQHAMNTDVDVLQQITNTHLSLAKQKATASTQPGEDAKLREKVTESRRRDRQRAMQEHAAKAVEGKRYAVQQKLRSLLADQDLGEDLPKEEEQDQVRKDPWKGDCLLKEPLLTSSSTKQRDLSAIRADEFILVDSRIKSALQQGVVAESALPIGKELVPRPDVRCGSCRRLLLRYRPESSVSGRILAANTELAEIFGSPYDYVPLVEVLNYEVSGGGMLSMTIEFTNISQLRPIAYDVIAVEPANSDVATVDSWDRSSGVLHSVNSENQNSQLVNMKGRVTQSDKTRICVHMKIQCFSADLPSEEEAQDVEVIKDGAAKGITVVRGSRTAMEMSLSILLEW